MMHPPKITSIILAAGKGTRMGAPQLQKACFPVAGQPAILRAISVYEQCGIKSHVIVVGHGAAQVKETVGSANNISYVYQQERRGTGHACRKAADLLQSFNYEDDLLIVAGDKIIEAQIVERMISTFYKEKADIAFIVGKHSDSPTAGRVIYSGNGRPVGIAESFDIAKCALLMDLWELAGDQSVEAEHVLEIARSRFPADKKIALALSDLWADILDGKSIKREEIRKLSEHKKPQMKMPNGLKIDLDQALSSKEVNLSVYLVKAPLLYKALQQLTSDNAQHEEYLTDIVPILTALESTKVCPIKTGHYREVMAFNSRDELDAINRALSRERTK